LKKFFERSNWQQEKSALWDLARRRPSLFTPVPRYQRILVWGILVACLALVLLIWLKR